MRIRVRQHGVQLEDSFRSYISHRVYAHLGRLAHEVVTVLVRIGDLNGPRGGVDKRCHVTVRGPCFGIAVVDDRHASPYAAVDSAVRRVATAVGRKIGRARSRRNSVLEPVRQ